jgi:hypothetical protein
MKSFSLTVLNKSQLFNCNYLASRFQYNIFIKKKNYKLVGWDFGYCGHYWPIIPAPSDSDGDFGETGGMKIDRGNRNTQRKPSPAPLCPSQIPHD